MPIPLGKNTTTKPATVAKAMAAVHCAHDDNDSAGASGTTACSIAYMLKPCTHQPTPVPNRPAVNVPKPIGGRRYNSIA